jgi:AAA domain, putative AbiEii toxin, Type IV TA system
VTPIPQVGMPNGSQWRRWDPHIHAPGTLLNDQFKGNWEGYLAAIEAASPAVEVLGVTDYFSIGCYREVKKHHRAGRMPGVKLLFPNVEMRLDVATDKKRAVNLHLLFSPDDDDHEEQIERVLTALSFEFKSRQYRCTPADLLSLGRAYNPAEGAEHKCRCEGANQFKVTLGQVRDLFRSDAWIVRNCIVAVSASSNDGTAGLQKDASFAAWRKELERFAHVIFASTHSVRDFWLGRNASDNVQALEREYGGKKPCLHGSDAHCVDRVAAPEDERYCWIKGDPTFESLWQAVLEPEERVWIGRAAPERHDAGMCIAQIATSSTPWLSSGPIPLNSGLVAIIGARGSGKTALADMVAIGADVISPHALDSSFLSRASRPVNYLKSAAVQLTWGDNTVSVRHLCPEQDGATDSGEERVRYLSQQFVEQLCSAAGLAVELRREIERVIFNATDPSHRLDADSFEQLADIYLSPIRRQRHALQESIANTSSQVVAEEALHNKLEGITKEHESLILRIEKTKGEMMALMPKGNDARARRLATLEAALAAATTAVDKQRRARVRVEDLQKEIHRLQTASFPQHLAKLRVDFQEAGLSAEDWQAMALQFAGQVDLVLTRRMAAIDSTIRAMIEGDPSRPVDVETDEPSRWPCKLLLAERNKVKEEVGIDTQRRRRYSDLQQSLEKDERSLQRATAELENARGAKARRQALVERRRDLYCHVFQSYLDEQQVLKRLYGPLQQLLEGAHGALSRLRFSVSREVNLKAWVDAGENLLDLRKESRLRGHGGLYREADRILHGAWKVGTAENVGNAVQTFIQEFLPDIRKAMPSTISQAKTSEWLQRIASWLYSTDHIQMRYSITYDGVAIEHLSPGTRGIVLLLLYLVIDKHDQRPLIIDQPEENLDPKSVFDELVPHFREARRRRQVVIVTHNANLVVNTDADQVIVASSERKDGVGLPKVSYRSGSLENPDIRKAVCDTLEGGERAFRDRERRYRLRWDPPQ